MAQYKIRPSQTIWDVALHLYGSIEGVFDLLISNPKLSVNEDLTPGTKLEYHDYFIINEGIVQGMRDNGYIPSNDERHIYPKISSNLRCLYRMNSADDILTEFTIKGEGTMVIDWGDNTDLETIVLSNQSNHVVHNFNSEVDERVIKIYGDFTAIMWDISKLGGSLQPIKPIIVDEIISQSNSNSLDGLFLFDNALGYGTVKVDLQGMYIEDLSPIADMMNLQELHLEHVNFKSVDVLDEYLHYIAHPEHHGNRINCKVYLTQEPSQNGMEAIQTILGEEEWNQAGSWEFHINDTIYTTT